MPVVCEVMHLPVGGRLVLIVLYVIKTMFDIFMIFFMSMCVRCGEPVPAYSVGVKKSQK